MNTTVDGGKKGNVLCSVHSHDLLPHPKGKTGCKTDCFVSLFHNNRATLSRPLHSKLKKFAKKFKDISRKNGIQGLFKDFPKNSRTFQTCTNPAFS